MNKYYIGWDNGATGTVGIVSNYSPSFFFVTPIITVQNYTKQAQNVSRVNVFEMKKLLKERIPFDSEEPIEVKCLIERPFMAPVETLTASVAGQMKKVPSVNMMFLKASLNAHRAFEASLILLESMKIGYEVVDSKAWQKEMLGSGIKGSAKLKEASKLKGIQMFPEHEILIRKHKDADGLMLAEFCRRYYNQ